jgi:hypothetical protein
MRTNFGTILLVILVMITATMVLADPDPLGASLTTGPSSRGTDPGVNNATAGAGNTTPLNLAQTRITDTWQGFFGNVSGQIVLENAVGNNFYDWSVTSLTGEVYATRNQVSDWSTVNCSNITYMQSEETSLSIVLNATDGVNETFISTSHPGFSVGTTEVSGCPSTRPYNSTAQSGMFWNVLLRTTSVSSIYTVLLADDQNAFDGGTADFEILVPVNRTTGQAVYFFYTEIN